jgi:formylmethanofuran dehydrogenase subunit A
VLILRRNDIIGAEIFDVEINFDGVIIAHGTKVTSKKNKDSKTTLTFSGDVTTSGKNTGGTISIERLYWPSDINQAIALENKLNSNDIKVITCTGTGYLMSGEPYRRTITGTHITVTSDEEDWSPSDGISQKLEVNVDKLIRKAERI